MLLPDCFTDTQTSTSNECANETTLVPAAACALVQTQGQAVRMAMPDYRWLYTEMSRLDAQFLHVHARVKTCAEQIAFFDGGQVRRDQRRGH